MCQGLIPAQASAPRTGHAPELERARMMLRCHLTCSHAIHTRGFHEACDMNAGTLSASFLLFVCFLVDMWFWSILLAWHPELNMVKYLVKMALSHTLPV